MKHSYLARFGLFWLFLWLACLCGCQEMVSPVQEASASTQEHSQSFVSVAEQAIEEGHWIEVQDGIEFQVLDERLLGVRFSEEVPAEDQDLWRQALGARWVVGDVHATDVTPKLWRALDVRLEQPDGAVASIQMLRPLWWLAQTGARAGGTINLEVTEAGLEGEAHILSIQDNVRVDSRTAGGSVVIGKIRHENAKVLHLILDGDESQPLGVTPNHPLMSADRGEYVAAGDFEIGESIRTQGDGTSTVTAIVPLVSSEPVYNLEIHRAQSYFVGPQMLLAHNTCITDDIIDFYKAPAGSRLRSQIDDEVVKGFNPKNYPGEGPFFTLDPSIARGYSRSYGNGIQTFRMPKSDFNDLTSKSIIKTDFYEKSSFNVPEEGLKQFNQSLMKGPNNSYNR